MENNDQREKLYAKRASFYERFFVETLGWGRELDTFFRNSNYLQPSAKILDAGCGTGIVTRLLYQIAQEKGYTGTTFHAFDLSPNMLDIFRQWIDSQQAKNIQITQADVLAIEHLPSDWNRYNLIVSSTMLEYLPKTHVKGALINLRQLLCEKGILLIFITKRNPITRWLAGTWWKTNLYEDREIEKLLYGAGFDRVQSKSLSAGWSNSIMVLTATVDIDYG